MAIYHFSVKIISRARGSSAVASAAYRAGLALHDERLGRTHDFTSKTGVIHSEILAPSGTPARWSDRQTLWNEVEAVEVRKDAQLAREVEFALPRELDQAQGVALARSFVQREFVDRGMVADLNVHWDFDERGQARPHAHVMLSLRKAGPEGFEAKARAWNDRGLLEGWREAWANHVNLHLAELDIDACIDHRTLEAQGIDLEPQQKIGPAGARREARGEEADRALEHRLIARRNGERLIADPDLALQAITHQQSTFTDLDLKRFVHRHSDDKAQFDELVMAVKSAPNLVALGQDGAGRERYTSREMLQIEHRLERDALLMAERTRHRVSPLAAQVAEDTAAVTMSPTQQAAFTHVMGAEDLALVVGYAGSGKSTMLGAARQAWTTQGYRVRGAALSGMAADGLQNGSGIPARTIASLEHAWAQGRDRLARGDVLVIDEAGMIGSRQMQRVLAEASQAGSKVVLVGDAEQLQAIEAGAAFRALTERHGAAEITEIQRQREDWQREATKALATGRTAQALERYEAAGMVQGHATREEASQALVDGWAKVRREQPALSQVMLAHRRADVARLNMLARDRLTVEGALGSGRAVATERGERMFAQGDRLMFLRNERSLGVKNGSLATLVSITGDQMIVRLDGQEGRRLEVDLKTYNHLDHGYAATIHKSQGVTVDRAHLLATDGLDRHAAYVGLSRHRQAVAVHYGADDFRDRDALARALGRDRSKDMTLDYEAVFAERRWLPADPIRVLKEMAAPVIEKAREPVEAARSIFAGLKLQTPAKSVDTRASSLDLAIGDYVAAFVDVRRMDGKPLPHQVVTLDRTYSALSVIDQAVASDLRAVLDERPELAVNSREPSALASLRKAVAVEGELRGSADKQAKDFVETWTRLRQGRASSVTDAAMRKLVNGVAADRHLEAALRPRWRELGLSANPVKVRDLGRALTRVVEKQRGNDLSL